ncbi:PA14 domain-containing protein [Planctomycetota bacterium]
MWKSLVLVLVVSVLLLSGAAQAGRDITGPFDTVVGVPDDGDWPPNELPPFAVDDQVLTKYLHYKGGTQATGFRVTPVAGATVVTGLTFTTANDADGRDPVDYELSGSNVSIDGPYTLIAQGPIEDFAGTAAWPRRTKTETPIEFENDVAYEHYQVMFPTIRTAGNYMQIAEVELLTPVFKASDPDPADGAIYEDTWATLGWTVGEAAVSHDVYMSTNQADVELGAAEAFIGNQAVNYIVVGFPGFPYPEGLQPGTTYYWRVDEINEGHPDSPWTGDVWSFTVPPKKAWQPDPPNGAKFVDLDADLSWNAGWGAKMHTVYFGETFDDVNDATGGMIQISTTYPLDPLELGATYYWRVDEFDGAATYKGDVWNFTATSGGGGILGEYFNNATLSGAPALTRIDRQVDFSFGAVSPGIPVRDTGWSARWTADLNVLFTDTYTFSVNSEGGTRLWIDGKQILDMWVSWVPTEYAGLPIYLESGVHSLRLEYYHYANGEQHLYWSAPTVDKQIIPAGPLQPPYMARRSNPSDGAVDVKQTPTLRWVAGYSAVSHQVYFGTDADAVRSAGVGSPEDKGAKDLGDETLDAGQLESGATYYWRVDEVNDLHPDSPWIGNVWSFTTADFLIVDDFEDYTDDDAAGEAVWQTWVDGFGVANNGAQAGNLLPPYCEQTIVHNGAQSLPFLYNNTLGVTNSEVTLALGGMDLAQKGGTTLKIWSRGDAANDAVPMYVALDNARVNHPDPAATQVDEWVELDVDLQSFVLLGANPSNANVIAIGAGDGEGAGTLYIDDIGVH